MADQIFNLKLVTEIEKHPCLYNYTLPEYSRKDLTERAWDDVGQTVNLSRSECKERWKNLRAVFVRHLRLQGSSGRTKPYYLADAMAFALPFVRTAHNARSVASKRPHIEDSDDDTPADRPSPCSSPASQAATLPSPQPSTWKKPLEVIEDPLRTQDAREEANRMFLLSLLPDVNFMTPGQVRHFKRRVMEVVDDILGDYVKTEPG